MKYLGILAFILVIHSKIAAQQITIQNDSLIISEIMFYPASGNNEFVEIYNLSSTHYADLENYQFRYYTSLPDTIVDAGSGTILPPKSYGVILEGDYDFAGGIYKNVIPENALLLKINNNTFGSNGMANTTSRPVWLISSQKDTIDCRLYSADNSSSYSDEKKILVFDTSTVVWGNSKCQNGTPGFTNSILQNANDLRIERINIFPTTPIETDDLEILVTVLNKGFLPAAGAEIKFYIDANADYSAEESEEIYSEYIPFLQSNDSLIVIHSMYNLLPGEYYFIALLQYGRDEYTEDNIAFLKIIVAEKAGYNDILINEIMYAPQNGEPEWVEIYNNSTNSVNLKKWKIKDAAMTVQISAEDFFISPGSYTVLSKDSLFQNYYPFDIQFLEIPLPALNNSGDGLFILDSLGIQIDTLNYQPFWGGTNNRSLERITPVVPSVFPGNWGTSINPYRATPGFVNSLTKKNIDISIDNFRTEEPYGITGEPAHFIIDLINKGSQKISGISVTLYKNPQQDSITRTEDEFANIFINDLLPGENKKLFYTYNYLSEGKNYFISKIDLRDEDTCNNTAYAAITGLTVNFFRNDISVNEIMYAPEGEPEWIEIFNKSDSEINLKKFKLTDKSDSVTITKTDYLLSPGKYLVISSDSSLPYIRNIPSGFLQASLPVMNNSGDIIILVDSLNRIIDSLEYSSCWGRKSGYSLERVDILSSSVDSSNWKTSVNKYKATPGYINSVSEKNNDISVEEIKIIPEFPVSRDTVSISVVVRNNGAVEPEANLKLYTDNSVVPVYTESFQVGSKSVKEIVTDFKIEGIRSPLKITAQIILQDDQDTSNNHISRIINYGYEPGSIVISEVHFSPPNGESEWVELFNRSNDTINIRSWCIKDMLTTPSSSLLSQNYLFLPESFILITSDSSVFKCHREVPSDVITLNLPNLNNDREGIVLVDNRGVTIDSMYYINSGISHVSLERISYDVSTDNKQNWDSSRDLELSTPGRINSVSAREFDLALSEINLSPGYPVFNDSVEVAASIINFGMHTAEEFSISFFADDVLVGNVSGSSLKQGELMQIKCPHKIHLISAVRVTVIIDFVDDIDKLNNFSEITVTPGEKSGSIVINEIMYDPLTPSPDWVEIYNPADLPMNLKNWWISDVNTVPLKSLISDKDIFIYPGEYFVISQDTSILKNYPDINSLLIAKFGSLSSTGDGIILYDYRSGIIDSVKYNSGWGGRNGRSLERKHPLVPSTDSTNWASSLNSFLATPGEKNSVSDLPDNTPSSVIINEIMYDHDFDNCEFIELYNRSSSEINIGGWRLEEGGKKYFVISDKNYILLPGSYFVFAADSAILKIYRHIDLLNTAQTVSLNLNNSVDQIFLKDLNGITIDSVEYSDNFHNHGFTITKNHSLERINPEVESNAEYNWSTSVSSLGATPGKINSVMVNNESSGTGVSVSPNPFSPDNDGWEDFTMINYSFTIQAPDLTVKIFDSQGRLVRTLMNAVPSGSKGAIIFDGRDDVGRTLRIGIYILYIEAAGLNGEEMHKSAIVIARKL